MTFYYTFALSSWWWFLILMRTNMSHTKVMTHASKHPGDLTTSSWSRGWRCRWWGGRWWLTQVVASHAFTGFPSQSKLATKAVGLDIRQKLFSSLSSQHSYQYFSNLKISLRFPKLFSKAKATPSRPRPWLWLGNEVTVTAHFHFSFATFDCLVICLLDAKFIKPILNVIMRFPRRMA